MAQQIIDVGAAPNDGTGDPIRTAYIKCNDNFAELYGRPAITEANDGVFDLGLSDNFSCTPVQNTTLTWTNIPAGQNGSIVFTNTSGLNITKDANTLCGGTFLATVSVAGTYLVNYFSDGSNVYLTTSGSLS